MVQSYTTAANHTHGPATASGGGRVTVVLMATSQRGAESRKASCTMNRTARSHLYEVQKSARVFCNIIYTFVLRVKDIRD